MNVGTAQTERTMPNAIWLTLRGTAARAAVSEAPIKPEVRSGRSRSARVGGRRHLRFRVEWIDAWLDASATCSAAHPRRRVIDSGVSRSHSSSLSSAARSG